MKSGEKGEFEKVKVSHLLARPLSSTWKKGKEKKRNQRDFGPDTIKERRKKKEKGKKKERCSLPSKLSFPRAKTPREGRGKVPTFSDDGGEKRKGER